MSSSPSFLRATIVATRFLKQWKDHGFAETEKMLIKLEQESSEDENIRAVFHGVMLAVEPSSQVFNDALEFFRKEKTHRPFVFTAFNTTLWNADRTSGVLRPIQDVLNQLSQPFEEFFSLLKDFSSISIIHPHVLFCFNNMPHNSLTLDDVFLLAGNINSGRFFSMLSLKEKEEIADFLVKNTPPHPKNRKKYEVFVRHDGLCFINEVQEFLDVYSSKKILEAEIKKAPKSHPQRYSKL